MTQKIAKENMSTHLVTIGWTEQMETAYRRMQEKKVRHLPVLNDFGEVVGMLSDRDVQRAMISQLERPAGRAIADEKVEFDREAHVRDYMSWPAKTVDQRTELGQLASRMVVEKVSSYLVMDGARAVGIVTSEDLLKVLAELLNDPKTPARWSLQGLIEDTTRDLRGVLI